MAVQTALVTALENLASYGHALPVHRQLLFRAAINLGPRGHGFGLQDQYIFLVPSST